MVPLVVLVAWPSGLVAVVVAVGVVVAVAVVVAVGWSVVVAGVGGGCSVPARGTMTTSGGAYGCGCVPVVPGVGVGIGPVVVGVVVAVVAPVVVPPNSLPVGLAPG